MFEFLGDYLVPFLFILTVLVFFHELGHFWVARRCGVRVEVFSVGFGPELFGWTDKHDTRWKFSAIPLGGYVKMFGDSDPASSGVDDSIEMTEEEKKVSFYYKPLKAKAAVVAAGPIANFILAVVILSCLYMFVGNPTPMASVGTIQENSAAQKAGFQTGDRITSIGGQDIKWFEELREIVSANPSTPLKTIVIRDGKQIELTVVPDARGNEGGKQYGFLGVSPDPEQIEQISVAPHKAVWMGIERTYQMSLQILGAVGEMITGERSSDELGGVLRIGQISGEMAKEGLFSIGVFSLMAALSVNLGLINLFPIPMLDGGHLVFYAAEAIRGKPLGEQAQEYGFRIGLVLVLSLMVFATWNDLKSLKVIEFITGLFT